MGIARGAVALLLEEAHRCPFHGRIATLGRQTIYTSAAEIARQFTKFQVKPNGAIDQNKTTVEDGDVFKWMGFEGVESMDYSDFEGATHVVDLNKDSISRNLVGAFDVVLDSGTLEHIFHLPNAIKNTLSLLKVGGRMIFLSPSSNHLDHGFYMFSPTLFADYFAANGFRIETLYVIRYSGDLNVLWDAYAYQPGQWRDMHIGGLDDRPYAIWAVATRLQDSTLDTIPQQGYYNDTSPLYSGSRLANGAAPPPTVSYRAPVITLGGAVLTALPHRFAGPARHVARKVYGKLRRILKSPASMPSLHGIFRKPLVGRY
jgi:SAM-dependent methyltransferase